MVKIYPVKCRTRRWPVQVFFNILNMAGINSWILFNKCNSGKISRRDFLIGLGMEILDLLKVSKGATTPCTPTSSTKKRNNSEMVSTPVSAKKSKQEQRKKWWACSQCIEETVINSIGVLCHQEGKRL
ncbi:unnamed protein product [Brachionus calyciflorus]|uniref:PiggyBac transposable element-derived protein domain-containing protein n=1 Tax=Brachionus calyciflorus TaxID=104777 RepID=A0A814HWW9_9BILA|nr:unnamed protein product [Brachionus calyciflorus]